MGIAYDERYLGDLSHGQASLRDAHILVVCGTPWTEVHGYLQGPATRCEKRSDVALTWQGSVSIATRRDIWPYRDLRGKVYTARATTFQ